MCIRDRDQTTDTKTATSDNFFGELKTAKISVTSTADKETISLDGDVVTYTITLTNDASAGAPMVNPFLVEDVYKRQVITFPHWARCR